MSRSSVADPAISRSVQIDTFIEDAGWSGATRTALAGDASARRYERLAHPALGPCVLMDADPAKGEDVKPFIRIANLLLGRGLSAPRILASDPAAGLLLIEDLGDDLFARLAPTDAALEHTLYQAAIDVLVRLHHMPAPDDLPPFGPQDMAPLASLATRWYAMANTDAEQRDAAGQTLADACYATLASTVTGQDVMVLRDYHAENLLWLPHRSDEARVGLLDFQDAGRGHAAYDVMSLLADARRDVSPSLREVMLAHYVSQSGQDDLAFRAACAAVSAQRNLRILGVFARLALRDDKPTYIALLPRVWGNLQRDLEHPACATLREVVAALLPPPTDALLARLRERAGTCPTG